MPHGKTQLRVGPLSIDRTRYIAEARNREIRLTPTELQLLWTLAVHCGRPLTRDQLLRQVWGPQIHVHVRTVDVHMSNLRVKLKRAGITSPRLETAWGIGYRMRLRNGTASRRQPTQP